MTELGSGLSLDDQWDLQVDVSSGDLETESGSSEVQKDLAFNVGRALEGAVGGALGQGELSDIELGVKKIIQADPRVESVESIETSIPSQSGDDVSIDVIAILIDGTTIEDVITV